MTPAPTSHPAIGVATEAGLAGPPPAWQLIPVLLTQGLWVKRVTPRLPDAPGPQEGTVGQGDLLRLLAVGDSIIAGVGVPDTDHALTAQLARALASRAQRQVDWRAVGRSGADSSRVLRMIDRLPDDLPAPDLVLLNNGVNDVASPAPAEAVNARRREVIEAMECRFPGATVFQCALPPMGLFPALPWPLRTLFGRRAAAFDLDLAGWMQSRSRSHFLPFDEMPSEEQFASDGYHPGPGAVAHWADKLAVHLLATRTSGS